MRVNENYKEINVASQVNDPNSLFSFWKQSLKIRKEYKDLLIYGSFKVLDKENQKIFTYVKEAANQKAYVVLNFTSENLQFKNLDGGDLELVNSNIEVKDENILCPYEGRIYLIK